jgi:bile acid:Na+ symporter, BASS family
MSFIEICTVVMKISLVIFMAGNLMEMGLRLDVEDALRGIRNMKFVIHTLVWGFVIGPAVAFLVTKIVPLDEPFAIGLILMGMAPCAPFIPLFVTKAKGDLGYTAAYMILVALSTIIFMPFAVPFMVKGLSISAWAIAKPLIIMILIPLIIGGIIRRNSKSLAGKMQPVVKKITILFTLIVFVLLIVIYFKGIISVMGSLAILSQLIFFSVLTIGSYMLAFGLMYEEKIVLSIGNSTRNLGAAIAPLFAAVGIAPEAIIMIVLSLPVMIIFPPLAIKLFGKKSSVLSSNAI